VNGLIFFGATSLHGQFANVAVYNLKAEMQAAVWSIPSTADSSPGDDNISSAPALQLQTRIDSSSYGDVKRFVICVSDTVLCLTKRLSVFFFSGF